MGILSGNPKEEPMHYGEVYNLWNYLSVSQGAVVKYQTLINHTGDSDLKKLLEDMIQNTIKPEIKEIETLLKENGIALPPAPADKPAANIEDIPAGARFTDPEVAAALGVDAAAGLVACSKIMGESIREDIGAMFGQFHVKKAQDALKILRLTKEKGWLIPPPLQIKNGKVES